MRRPLRTSSGAVLLLALALAGCSGSGSTAPKNITIPFKSSALADSSLPALYTCDGKNISPPVEWGAVPPATRELALFILGLTPTRGGYKTSVEWAVAGVNPALHGLAAGKLPPGAHVGLASSGKRQRYSICPAKGKVKDYQFALYAIPPTITVAPKFIGYKLLQVIANPISSDRADGGGAFVASYKRT
jgi:phosphatidylethanolamine-binding protein (PEBP) family uncharacterized protein